MGMTPGQPVTIRSSTHPDIRPGATGVIDCAIASGYGVAIEANYYQVSGGTKRETRVVFVERGDLDTAESELAREGVA